LEAGKHEVEAETLVDDLIVEAEAEG